MTIIIYTYTYITNNTVKLIFMTIILAYWYVSENSNVRVRHFFTADIKFYPKCLS